MRGLSAVDCGYRWVAEWDPHEATWISWPYRETTWPGRLHTIPPVTERVIRTLAEVEKVHVLGGPSESFEAASRALDGLANVLVHQIATNDVWIRDYGPTFVIDQAQKKLGAVRWIFNAWGNKYHPYDSDAAASKHICQGLDQSGHWIDEPHKDSENSLEYFESTLVCEGGALETDGQGTLLTTSSAVATGTRNPNWTREQIESEFKRQLGVRKVLWIDGGELAGDDTDSHIDQLVRFVRPSVVFAAVSSTSDDSNAPHRAKQYQVLRELTDAQGKQLEIIPLRTPPPRMIQGR
ncbi:MAG: agmatine/peptidylarginine deiminase, partial [Pirellula sp.]